MAAFGSGSKQTYLASLIGAEMKLLRVDPAPYELFTLQAPNLPQSMGPNGKPRVWGTAWAYREGKNVLFFSSDDGVGLYATQPNNLAWSAQPKKVFMNKVGEALSTDWNDGISCGPNWLVPDVDDCVHDMYRSTTEDLNKATAKSEILVLDPKTGAEKEGGWKVEAEGLLGINSCAINPIDHIIYCTLQFGNGNWLARLDSKGNIGYVLKVAQWNYAGTFDDSGNYWFYEGSGGLHKVTDLANYTAAPNTVGLSQVAPTTFTGPPSSSSLINDIGADLAIYRSLGKTYLVSILPTCLSNANPNLAEPFHNRVSFVDITDGTAKEPVILTDTENTLPAPLPADQTPPGQDKGCQTWGSSWNLELEGTPWVLFAPDSGQGAYSLVSGSVDLEQGTMLFEPFSKMEAIAWNNGFSCVHKDPKAVTMG